MKELPLISVVVPVYKVESYLDRCVESIVNQTYRNLEIILVDDGSPDNCPAMCDVWAERDSRIKVIHKENGGGGDARNIALDIAAGEYIGLIDSDDYIEPHMYEHLLNLMAEDVDIAECVISKTESDNIQLDDGSRFESEVYDVEAAMQLHITEKLFQQTPPNKLYRRSTIGDIRFPVGMRIDDEFWTYRVIARARKLVHSSSKMYAYRQQSDSVMHKKFALARLQAIDAKCQRLELVKEKFPTLLTTAKTNLWHSCFYMGQMSLLYLNRQDRGTAFGKLHAARAEYPLTNEDIGTLPFKKKLWLNLSRISLPMTCMLRNVLRIGF